MRRADCSNKSSQSLLDAASVFLGSPSPLATGEEWPPLFPGKEDIYDLDYPELQKLQKKLVHYLHKTTPTCPHRTSATGLLQLVKLEIQERQSCAFMLENILSMQSTCNSKDEGNTRVQNSADASAPPTSFLTRAPGAGVSKAAAQEGNASLDVHPSLTLPETNALTALCTTGSTVPGTFTYSDRQKATFPPISPLFRKGISSPVNSTLWSTGNITCFPSAEVSLDPESSKILNRASSTVSSVLKPDHPPPPHNSVQPRSRVSNFAALAKKLFDELSPPVPSFSVLLPPPEPPCDAKVPCASPLKVVKRSRRKVGGAKLSGHKGGTQNPQKKSRRRCADKLPSDVKGHASCSIERRPSKEKPVTRETTSFRTAPLHCDSAAACVSLANTQTTTACISPQVAEASAAPQEEKQKNLHAKKEEHCVARSLLNMSLGEQPNTEASNGSRDPIKGLCKISKADTNDEGKAKFLGRLNKLVNPSLCTEQKESAGCATATSLLDSTSSTSVGDNNSDTRTSSCSTHRLLPLVESVEQNAHVTSSDHASCDVTFNLGKKSSSPPPPVNKVLFVQGNSEDAQESLAIVSLKAVEAPTVDAKIPPEDGAAATLSHVTPVRKQQETGHQRFLRRMSHRYTDDLHKKKAVEVEQDEGDGRQKGRSVHCMDRTLLSRDLFVRREEARRQRSGSTGGTQKKVPVKQKNEGTTSGSALTTAEDIDVIGSCVYQELAHISIRKSARGVIGDIDSIIQAMTLKTAEQDQHSETTESESAAATTTPTALPAALTEVAAGITTPDENNFPCSAVPRCCTDDGRSEQGDTAKKIHSSDIMSISSDSDSPSVKHVVQNANETDGTVQSDGRGKQATDLSDGSNASMEKVYALLAALNEQPSRESCANANEPLKRSGISCSTAFGWRIQIGNEDDVDPVCQTISIKKTQEKEQGSKCLMVEERNISPSRGPKNSKTVERDRKGGLCPFKQETKRWSSPTHTKRHLSLSLRKTDLSPIKGVTTTQGCGHNEDNTLLCKIQCQFPTLADLLTEGEKAKHAGTLRDILVNNQKCCADLCQLEDYKREHAQKMNCASECKSNHVLTRFYKVEKNRPEVFSIVCRAMKKEEGWEPVPEGQHWEYGWNLLWTWRPPRINYNKLLSFQKVNHFPEGRHLTRKDKLKSCIERYQKLAGKRSDLFNIIPKTYLMPKEHTALFNDMCEAEEQKHKSIWICKPKDGSRGRGIYLADSIDKIRYGENILVQDYIANPLLLNGRKFDLRLYVLVTSFNPLEAFVYKQGFARVARVPFSLDPEHLGNRFMHLTNASVQTKWQDPSESEDEGALKDVFKVDSPCGCFPRNSSLENENERDFTHTRSVGGESSKLVLDELRMRLEQSGLDWDVLWHRINLVILKSLSCCSDYIPFQPNSFELFGYDILIDADGKPWLIEVNSSPCMSQDYDIDRRIKPSLIEDTIRLVNPVVYDRFKLSSIIAGRLSDAVSTDGQSAALVSPRRGYHSNNQATESSASCSCASSSSTSTPSSSSYSSFRRGLLTHRPSRKATPDVKSGSEEWKKSQRTHVRRQYQQDLVALLNNTKPREYGELPAALGQYERIAPSKAWYQLQVLKQSLLGKNQRIDAGTA